MPDDAPNPNVICVPCNDPGAVEREYTALGWKVCDLYAKFAFPDLCNGRQWAVKLWRPEQPAQKELL